MKKLNMALVITMILMMISATALAEVPTVTAFKTENTMAIDGSLDEWTLESPIVIDSVEQVIRDGFFWQGPTDCSATAYVMWDDENLYLAVDVSEDSPFGAIEMLPLDGEDNLKIFLSTDPTADPARTAYSTNDFMVYMIMDNQYWDTAIDRSMVPKENRMRFISKGMSGGESVLEGYECAAVPTSTGFIFEAKIPLINFSNDNIAAYSPQSGDQVQFNLAITDISYPCPGTEYIPQMAWSGDININTNPSLWGTLIFE